MFRVLLVDDSSLIRASMQSVLEPFGIEVVHADNGRTALELATTSRWDLIFMDVVMPVMDGPTALRLIRAHDKPTPVVLVTSVSTAQIVAEAVKLGNVHYMSKPFSRDQVRAIATKLLKLDASVLATPPRLLLQHNDPSLQILIRTLLPAHVVVETTTMLSQTLEMLESGPRDLVIVESDELGDEMIAVANVLRRTLPSAGIFAITDDPAVEIGWCPVEGIDGFLPRELDEKVVRGFLTPSFLRPLVRFDRMVAHVSAFAGPAEHFSTYLAMVVRILIDRCTRIDGTADIQIDLSRMPTDPAALVYVISTVSAEIQKRGPAPTFRVLPAMRAATAAQLSRFVLLAS